MEIELNKNESESSEESETLFDRHIGLPDDEE